MKKLLQSICGAACCLMLSLQANAQSDIVTGLGGNGHDGGTNNTFYVGWDANTQFPLNIRHFRWGQPIVFSTNNGNINVPNPTNSTDRMWILPGQETLVGIGLTA